MIPIIKEQSIAEFFRAHPEKWIKGNDFQPDPRSDDGIPCCCLRGAAALVYDREKLNEIPGTTIVNSRWAGVGKLYNKVFYRQAASITGNVACDSPLSFNDYYATTVEQIINLCDKLGI